MVKWRWRKYHFFHLSTIHRRRCNRILSLYDIVGNWMFDTKIIHQIILNHFRDFYTTPLTYCQHEHPPTYLNSLTPQYIHSLSHPLLNAEIAIAVRSFKPLKSPGPDDLYPIFFQIFWHETNQAVIHTYQQAFSTCSILPKINKTNITLIPKTNHPESITQYRSIGLCNTIYKIITKIIVNRIRPLMLKLINPTAS